MCKKTLIGFGVLGLLFMASVGQADGIRSAANKITGDYPTQPRTIYYSQPANRPMVVQSQVQAPAPAIAAPSTLAPMPADATAQAPAAARRSFSYDPATAAAAPAVNYGYGVSRSPAMRDTWNPRATTKVMGNY